MITVLHSVQKWLPQTETWLFNQVGYSPSSVNCHVFCETTENLDQFWLPNIHSLSEASFLRYFWDKGIRKARFRRYFGYLLEQARSHDVQILHSHFGDVGWVNIKAAKRARIKHVVTFYGYDVNYLIRQDLRWRKRYRYLFDNVDYVLCEGPHMAKSIVNLGCPESKVRVHHLGVPMGKIKFQPRRWDSSGPLRILISGSFREKKGIPFALEALGRMQEYLPIEITIIGDASDARGEIEKRKILSIIQKYNLETKTRLLGYQPHNILFKEAYNHHIFLSPSITSSDGDTEGGAPVTIIEMLASGMPIVSTKHCDIPEVIRHNVDGLLANERNVDELVQLIKWLSDNPGMWVNMVKAGRERLEKEFDALVQGEKLAVIYGELVANH